MLKANQIADQIANREQIANQICRAKNCKSNFSSSSIVNIVNFSSSSIVNLAKPRVN